MPSTTTNPSSATTTKKLCLFYGYFNLMLRVIITLLLIFRKVNKAEHSLHLLQEVAVFYVLFTLFANLMHIHGTHTERTLPMLPYLLVMPIEIITLIIGVTVSMLLLPNIVHYFTNFIIVALLVLLWHGWVFVAFVRAYRQLSIRMQQETALINLDKIMDANAMMLDG